MWVSSFVVTLPDDCSGARAIKESLHSVPVFELGEPVGRRLPVVLEAEDGATARYWHHWIEELPGVVNVEVAFVNFEDEEQSKNVQQPVDHAVFAAEKK
jgi:nitrate reductase NapAB chaperone NapD